MSAAVYPIMIEKGTTWEFSFPYGQMVAEVFTPINVTGWTARMQFRDSVTAASPIAEFTTANGKITVDGPSGTFSVIATDAETSSWNFESAVYDFEAILPSGKVKRLLKGTVTLDPEVTR